MRCGGLYIEPFRGKGFEIFLGVFEAFSAKTFERRHDGGKGTSMTDSAQPFHEEHPGGLVVVQCGCGRSEFVSKERGCLLERTPCA